MKLDFRLGFSCILTIIWHHFYNILGTISTHGLSTLLNGEYFNPVYGLVMMTFKYDALFVLPLGVL